MGIKRKCENRLCDNLSRSFENKYCSQECADCHDGIISELEWVLVNPYTSWVRKKATGDSREGVPLHFQTIHLPVLIGLVCLQPAS